MSKPKYQIGDFVVFYSIETMQELIGIVVELENTKCSEQHYSVKWFAGNMLWKNDQYNHLMKRLPEYLLSPYIGKTSLCFA